jgi:glycosyltransferase involved in cell wall biosynthesis
VDYVVVDGVSSDETVDIIRRYETKFNSQGIQLRWVSEPDEGIYDAMNKGVAMAQGDIIGILNSDDFYEPHTLEAIAEACIDHPEVGIFYGFLRFLKDGKELQVYRYRYEHYLLNLELGVHSAAQHPTCFVRRDVYDRIGTFDTQFPVAADYDFLIRAMQAGVRFFPLDTVLTNFRSGGASVRMSDYERHRQRYAVWYKNGLISEEEYRNKQKKLRGKRFRELKRKVMQWLLRL